MPSLRRTASSPAVRSSPYSNGTQASRGNGHRRSSGSETASRRVLADIEWWRVTEGQCDPTVDQEAEDPNRGTQELVDLDVSLGLAVPVTHVEAGLDHPVSLPWVAAGGARSSEITFEPPTDQFSALAITPHTPTRRHHILESSASSLESTPEATDATLHYGPSLSDLEIGFSDTLPPLPLQRRNRLSVVLPVMKRSFTFADCLSLKDDHTNQYADFATSPLSSAPDFLN